MTGGWRPAGQRTALTGFAVQLEEFEGPLDLLLHLIDKQGLDVTGVSVLTVTDQFIAYASQLEDRFADAASEFLLVGSQLALLKSRALLPRPERTDDEATVEDLATRLQVYAVFKAVAADLDARLDAGASSLIRVAAPLITQPPAEPGAGDLDTLIGAIERMLDGAAREIPVFTPPTFRFRVSDKIQELSDRLRDAGEIAFQTIADACTDRAELVVSFLAVLHLAHERKLRVEQRVLFGPITLRALAADD